MSCLENIHNDISHFLKQLTDLPYNEDVRCTDIGNCPIKITSEVCIPKENTTAWLRTHEHTQMYSNYRAWTRASRWATLNVTWLIPFVLRLSFTSLFVSLRMSLIVSYNCYQSLPHHQNAIMYRTNCCYRG